MPHCHQLQLNPHTENIFLSGPYTADKVFAVKLFRKIQIILTTHQNPLNSNQLMIFNPIDHSHYADMESEYNINPEHWYALDYSFLMYWADSIYMLPGWEKSNGACAEYALAINLGLKIYKYPDLLFDGVKSTIDVMIKEHEIAKTSQK